MKRITRQLSISPSPSYFRKANISIFLLFLVNTLQHGQHPSTFFASALSLLPNTKKPELKSLPLPLKLAGGLFLFSTSVKQRDKELSQKLLRQAEVTLRNDPLISMELGTGLEAGGIFSSSSTITDDAHQLVMEFQINGGNSWAQCQCYGYSSNAKNNNIDDDEEECQILSLRVSNMDAALSGGWMDVKISTTNNNDDLENYYKQFIP
mmetsp:Transcript_13133/g.15026  ORF Transcript_13133/g.15026 Transcript_13133/m.15026 type:complete len:208 (-) Transcript_13133:48-671(-)